MDNNTDNQNRPAGSAPDPRYGSYYITPDPAAQVQKKRLSPWIIALIVLAALALIYGGYVLYKNYNDTGSDLDFDSDYVAIIDIDGEISSSSSSSLLSSGTSYDHAWTMQEITDLETDEHNKGILFRVNTPGGSVYTSDELYFKIREYQDTTKHPVYAYFASQATSGGYYVSACADKIYANRNCWTGSIGVTMGTIYDLTDLMEKYGIKAVNIDSGENKSIGSYANEFTEEQQALLQELVDEAYDQFVGIVADGRGLSIAEVKKVADGRILSAQQALKAKLIDGIMDEQAAIDKMKQDENLSDCSFEYLEPEYDEVNIFSYFMGRNWNRSAGSELSELEALLEANGSITISYKAAIYKQEDALWN